MPQERIIVVTEESTNNKAVYTSKERVLDDFEINVSKFRRIAPPFKFDANNERYLCERFVINAGMNDSNT